MLFLQNQWKEMFPCLISKAATVDIICKGEDSNKNGAVQLVRGKWLPCNNFLTVITAVVFIH